MSIKSFSKLSLVAIAAGVALSGMASAASAGGLVGDIINQVAPGVGTRIDIIHGGIGAPLNQVPGQIVRQLPGGQYFGDHCATPVGVFGPGPVLPVGTPCHAAGYPGQVVR